MEKNDASTDNPAIIDLIRHGRTVRDNIFRGVTDDPLSEPGWLQMNAAVGDERWDRIISSPLGRCRKFAAELAEKNQLQLETDQRLSEYDFGDWDGKTYHEVMNKDAGLVERFFADPFSHRPPNGELFVDFTQRVLQGWRQLSGEVVAGKARAGQTRPDTTRPDTTRPDTTRTDTTPPGKTLVVAHGGVIMTILADVLGVDRLHGRIEMPYACRSRIRLDQGGKRPRLVFHG